MRLIFMAPPSGGPGRADALDMDAQQHSPFTLHCRPVLVPVGMLTGHHSVVADEAIHSRRQRLDAGRTFSLYPPTEECVLENTRRGPAAEPHIGRLHRAL